MKDIQYFQHIRELGGDRYQEFLDAGYREWRSGAGDEAHKTLLQRAIRDNTGKHLFFVDVWVWDWSEFRDRVQDLVTYTPSVHFNMHGDRNQSFEVKMHDSKTMTISQIEAFFEKIYKMMNCQPCDVD